MKQHSLSKLYGELDEWNFIGEEAVLWWRDDDVVASSAALKQLLDLSARYEVPLALAAIAAHIEESLIPCVEPNPTVTMLQHGYTHENHAPENEKKQELGAHRKISEIGRELQSGFDRLGDHFGDRFAPILVPPWNRIGEEVLDELVAIGFKGISTFKPRVQTELRSGLWAVNAHVDIMDWKNTRGFLGEEQVVEDFVNHLSQKRNGVCDAMEPTGLLTHHLVHDDACWDFLERFLQALDDHPAVKWIDATKAFQLRWR